VRLTVPNPNTVGMLVDWWLRVRKTVGKVRRPAFDSMVILIVWYLWLQRNIRVFDGACKTPSVLLVGIWGMVDIPKSLFLS
jgi:hypothetical protein